MTEDQFAALTDRLDAIGRLLGEARTFAEIAVLALFVLIFCVIVWGRR